MSNSFSKNFVQLSSVGLSMLIKQSAVGISTLLKDSAKVIETAANVVDWAQFEITAHQDSTVLTYDLKDLDPSEYEVNYNGQYVRLNIRPYCQDYLIPNMTRFFSYSGYSADKRVRLEKFAKAHQHLRWDTCTVDELNAFCSDWIFGVEGESGGDYPWQSRAMAMLKPILSGVIQARDSGACTLTADLVKGYFNLDSYLSMIGNEHTDQSSLMAYLHGLPGFHIEDYQAGSLSPRAYEVHGHLTMQLLELFATDQKSSVVRKDRRPDRDITRNFMSKTIVSAEAVRVDNRLEITVKHASKEFVRLKIKG